MVKGKLNLIFFFIFCFINTLLNGMVVTISSAQKCFIEEVPKDTLILAKFSAYHFNTQPDGSLTQGIGIKSLIRGPDNQEIIRRVYEPEGRIAFTSEKGGEHTLCFSTNSSRWFGSGGKIKFDLDLQSGVGATDYDDVAKKEHLEPLELKVRKLNDRVTSIRKEQNYQKSREQAFRNTSESTFSRVSWWAICQSVIVVWTGLWQIRHLKSFFKSKKLV